MNKGIPNPTSRIRGRAITLKKDLVMLRSMLIDMAVNGTLLINKIKSNHAMKMTRPPSCHSGPLAQKHLLALTLAAKTIVKAERQISI